MTLNPMCEMVETAQGVALTVTGVAQVKIMKVISPNDCHVSSPEGRLVFSSSLYFHFPLGNNFYLINQLLYFTDDFQMPFDIL